MYLKIKFLMPDKGYNHILHKGASPSKYVIAQNLRQGETEAEKKLWVLLRGRKLEGKKFRRQHPFDKFILDFYCHECKLAVELDGEIHKEISTRQYDSERSDMLRDNGITVIRFWNSEVMENPEKVLDRIATYLI